MGEPFYVYANHGEVGHTRKILKRSGKVVTRVVSAGRTPGGKKRYRVWYR